MTFPHIVTPCLPVGYWYDFDTGTVVKRLMLNITELADITWCQILWLYSWTICFYRWRHQLRIGRQEKDSSIKKKGQKAPRFQQALCKLGEDWDVNDGLADELANLTCTIHGYPRISRIDVVRSLMLNKMVGKSEKITKSCKVDFFNYHPAADISHKFRGQITVQLSGREPRRVW